MAIEIDTTEARRKALRNGEEDPVVVAQRFLNIYRQMHIFSAERKEAFNQMLLELSPSVRGIFGSLPGGTILQDYVDDLAEKAGIDKSVHTSEDTSLNSETNQQAQILATALAKAQSQTSSATNVVAGSAKLSMDKDFAENFARIMGNVIQEQTASQNSNLEKLTLDLSKTQLFIAKTLKENKDEQRLEIGALCKAIIQSQTALSSSLTSALTMQTDFSNKTESETKRLIDIVLESQKQLSLHINKMEELSSNKANDNIKLIEAFEKSQSEIIRSLSNIQSNNSAALSRTAEDDERLVQLISQSQENLIKTVMSASLQQNNNSTMQSNNNANNIQINTTDNSGQLMLLVEKIAALQAANEENLEKAIIKAVEAQSKIYDKISRKQTKELAEVIADGLRSSGGVTYVSQPIVEQSAQTSSNYATAESNFQINDSFDILPQSDDIIETFDNVADIYNQEVLNDTSEDFEILQEEISLTSENTEIFEEVPKKKKKRKKKKKSVLTASVQVNEEKGLDNTLPQDSNLADTITNNMFNNDSDIVLPIQEFDVKDFSLNEQALEIDDIADAAISADIQESISEDEKLISPTTDNISKNNNTEYFDIVSTEVTADDWGFNDISTDETPKNEWGFGEHRSIENSNDNIEGQDWEWVYVEDNEDKDYLEVESIGDNTFIYKGDLYTQEKVSGDNQIMYGSSPIYVKNKLQIYDEVNSQDFADPYKNSILKD